MKTIGSIESFTGGLFAATICEKPGASTFFKGSVITYANELKAKIGVDVSKGVINQEVAKQMAMAGKKLLNVDYCVSFTGNAGPSTMEDKPVGTIYIAINQKVYSLNLQGSRLEIQKQAVNFALTKINKLLKEK